MRGEGAGRKDEWVWRRAACVLRRGGVAVLSQWLHAKVPSWVAFAAQSPAGPSSLFSLTHRKKDK
eukprot:6207741-Pleurochrysis_carterae.AAC.4